MKLVATTISRQNEDWELPEIPYYCETWPMTAPVLDPFAYTLGLAKKRNLAVDRVLLKHPDTTHILMCDSYYVHQTRGLKRLVNDYEQTDKDIILGGAVWGKIRARATDLYRNNYVRWFDEWAVPEFRLIKYREAFEGLVPTSSVPGVFIFPRSLWDKGIRFGQYRLLDKNEWHHMQGCELNYFCSRAPAVKMIDFNARFYRERVYPKLKCLRISLHLGRFLPWRYLS